MAFVEQIIARGKELNDDLLSSELDKITKEFNGLNFKETVLKLQRAFEDANYRGVYEAFTLELECKDRI